MLRWINKPVKEQKMAMISEIVKKYADEWKVTGEYFSPWNPEARDPRRNYPITPRENYTRLFSGKKPLYIPEVNDSLALAPRMLPDNLARHWVIEADPLRPDEDIGDLPDMFGVVWQYIPVTMGCMVRPGDPKIPDINHWEDFITFPDMDRWDWEGSAAKNAHLFDDARMNRVWVVNGLNERLISLMDFANVMVAYIDEDQKDGVKRFYGKLCDFYDDLFARYHKYYKCDIVMFNDDWGTQRAPQFSTETAREMLVPYMKRLSESAHKYDMYFELHCCGKNDLVAPAIAECGFDLWLPQENINDFGLLYELLGDKLALGIPTGTTPEMTDEEVFAAAASYMEKFGKKGNIILNSMFQHPKIAEYIYAISREMYS
jgi:hypothetical protein